MNEVATSLTPSRDADLEGPSIDELIKAGSLHQRLAAARVARAKALALSAERPDQFLSGRKPWERPEYMRGEPRKALRDKPARDRGAVTLPPLVLNPEIAPLAVSPALAAPASAVAPPAPNRVLQIAVGAGFGIAIGIGLGYWFAGTTLPDATVTIALRDEAPARPDSGSSPEVAGIALPATDATPMRGATPMLTPLALPAAAPPAIAGGGPLQREAAVAPERSQVPLTPETAPAAPAAVDQPLPRAKAALGLPDTLRDSRFAGLAGLPGNAAVASIVAALPVAEAALPALPAAPDAVAAPSAWQMPLSMALPLTAGDTPLAPQVPALPVSGAVAQRAPTLILHAPAALPETEVEAFTGKLAAEGFQPPASQPVDFTISQTNVRYFSPEDAELAAAVANALNAKLRDFTSFSPRPPAGTVEIWLAGPGGVTAKPKATSPAKAKTRRDTSVSAVDALKNRLIRQLRAGTLN